MNAVNDDRPTGPRGPRWFRWLAERFTGPPQVQHLPWATRARIVARAQRRAAGRRVAANRKYGCALWITLAIAYFLLASLMSDLFEMLNLPEWLHALLNFIIVMAPFPVLLAVYYRSDRDALRHVLLEEGIRPAVCFDCGYDLRGTESHTCPECGADILDPPNDR